MYFIVIWICISQMIHDTEYFLIDFSYLPSFVKYLFKYFAYFKIQLFVFILLSCTNSFIWIAMLCQTNVV